MCLCSIIVTTNKRISAIQNKGIAHVTLYIYILWRSKCGFLWLMTIKQYKQEKLQEVESCSWPLVATVWKDRKVVRICSPYWTVITQHPSHPLPTSHSSLTHRHTTPTHNPLHPPQHSIPHPHHHTVSFTDRHAASPTHHHTASFTCHHEHHSLPSHSIPHPQSYGIPTHHDKHSPLTILWHHPPTNTHHPHSTHIAHPPSHSIPHPISYSSHTH